MSNPAQDPSHILANDDLPVHLSPETLKQRLADLIRLAARQGSGPLTETVARHLQALYLHPSPRLDPVERAAYCRAAKHWRGLARVHPALMA
ncbi:ATP dependent RNA helicase [Thiohalocapsa marina]|uniref:ATP dependent RNA helicase n=1 Tax=Thiohalocapsa marina TaxID=424902 RepID=UPI0036D906A9|nr:ATP dependent RNA helicase [Sphingobacteriia bacterium]NCC41062.1 ATP dependent RNA helicase [Gammaproteobacteria bacterium]